MSFDPLEDLRKVKHTISAQFDHDIDKLLAHLKKMEERERPERFFRPS